MHYWHFPCFVYIRYISSIGSGRGRATSTVHQGGAPVSGGWLPACPSLGEMGREHQRRPSLVRLCGGTGRHREDEVQEEVHRSGVERSLAVTILNSGKRGGSSGAERMCRGRGSGWGGGRGRAGRLSGGGGARPRRIVLVNFPVVCIVLVNSDISFLHAGKGDASTPSGDASNETNQNQGEPKSSDTMYIPSNLSYWRDVRASFVRASLSYQVRPSFLVFAISSVL